MTTFAAASFLNTPTTVDYRMWAGRIKDQENTSMCSGEAITNDFDAIAARLGYKIELSPMYNYEKSRELLGINNVDAGSAVAAALAAAKNGIATEKAWTFSAGHINDVPNDAAVASAANFKVLDYDIIYLNPESIIARDAALKGALAEGFFPLIGASINKQFAYEDRPLAQQIWSNTSIVSGNDFAGRHAYLDMFYGLSGTGGSIGGENSWGTGWGDHGFGLTRTPYYSDDAYVITKVEINGRVYDFHYTQERIQVTELYAALFGRAPEAAGLNYWAGELATGSTMLQVANSMYNVQQARSYYPDGEKHTQLVQSFYQNVLGRVAEAESLKYWVPQLDAGSSEAQVITSMVAATVAYVGSDPAGIVSRELFENKINLGMYYSVQMAGEDINTAKHLFDTVTADANSVELVKIAVAHDLGYYV